VNIGVRLARKCLLLGRSRKRTSDIKLIGKYGRHTTNQSIFRLTNQEKE